MKNYPVAMPYIKNREIALVRDVLRSGHLSLGPKYLEFEKKFAKMVGTKYACSVSSGTSGLHLVLLAAGIKPGDEVITSPFSFIASSNAILYVGARPIFVDIDPVSYNMDPKLIEQHITKKTKAILVVHIFGQPTDMQPVMRLARKYHLRVVEDACESIMATYRGQQVGTFGESAVFAFYPNKQMTTGEGGMIVTNSRDIYERCASLRNQGRGKSADWLDHQYIGYNYRLDEMSAAVGIAQLERLRWMIAQRRKIAKLYSKYLQPFGEYVIIPRTLKGNTHTWFVYVVRLANDAIVRDHVITELQKRGIHTKAYLPTIPLFDVYRRKFHYRQHQFPISEYISVTSLALPIYIGLRPSDIKYICRTLIDVIRRLDRKPRS
jgi:perosamine synthetase